MSREKKTHVLAQWPHWRDELVYWLRRQDMDGQQVGEVLKEIDAYVGESGESPQQAFGDPQSYAVECTVEPHPVGWTDPGTLAEIAGSLVGMSLILWSALLLARGDTLPFTIHPIVGALAGVIVVFLTLRQARRDNVTDPVTHHPMLGTPRQHAMRVLILCAVTTAIILMVPLVFV